MNNEVHNVAIGIDLGGTNIKGVVMTQDGRRLDHVSIETRDTGNAEESIQWKEAVKEAVARLRKGFGGRIDKIGLSAPGIVNEDNSAIYSLPNKLVGIEDFHWAEFLGEPYVPVLNDAHAALMAESRFGAGKGVKNIVMLTLGTGVGGGLLLDGKLFQGFLQRAGHIGHLTLDADDREQSIVGSPGSLENAIGDYTVSRRTFGRYTDTQQLVEAFRSGEPLATYTWLNAVRKLAVAINSMCNVISPELLIISGGITKAGTALFDPLDTFLDLYEWRPGGNRVAIKPAEFSTYAGAIGAAGFVLGE